MTQTYAIETPAPKTSLFDTAHWNLPLDETFAVVRVSTLMDCRESSITAETTALGAAAQRERPDPQARRGTCPDCGDDVVSNLYFIGGQGYLLCWECCGSLGASPSCSYRRVL